MKKISFISAAMLAFGAMTAQAGGLLTNTNQNAAYVRQMSQGGIIDITGLYFNPAGTAFLSNGWHLSLNSQSAFQQRNIETSFPLFNYNVDNRNATHRFEGVAKAPVIPSLSLSYNKDKWSVNAHFALIGGGGKCEFAKGLGSFEALYAGQLFQQVPAMVNQQVTAALPGVVQGKLKDAFMSMGIPENYAGMVAASANITPGAVTSQMTGYGLDAYMRGRSYYFGLQLGATYKFMDNLAGYVGLRGVYATCNYNGYVQDVKADYTYDAAYSYVVPANPALGIPAPVEGDGSSIQSGSQNLDSYGLALNADQTSFGIAPVIGIDYKINDKWNVAAKYEAPTVMKLKNSTEMNDFAKAQVEGGNATLAKFADGKKIREDIPGMLTLGAQYSPIEKVRLMGTFNEYFDKSAKKYNDEQKLIDKNTWEIILGAEYDICKYVTISASWQNTNYGMSDKAMNDLSFNLSSNMIGAGIRINATKRCSIDLGYMHTFYKDRTVNTVAGVLPTGQQLIKSDLYERKNDVFGIGVNLNF